MKVVSVIFNAVTNNNNDKQCCFCVYSCLVTRGLVWAAWVGFFTSACLRGWQGRRANFVMPGKSIPTPRLRAPPPHYTTTTPPATANNDHDDTDDSRHTDSAHTSTS
jgi:hypothetical protein